MKKLALAILLTAALLALPPAAAHTTVPTTDGKYTITVGNENEPVTTFTRTGLDLAIRANNTQRTGISGAHLTLNATLLSPGGQELTHALRAKFGAVGSYSFAEPYYLTQPGEYRLKLEGRINQTPVDFAGILVGSGPIPAYEGTTFPDNVANQKHLEDRIKALELDNAQLKADIADLKDGKDAGTGNAPGAAPLTVLLALAAVGLLASRRRNG